MKQADFMAICTPVAELVARKSQDYNSADTTPLSMYFPFQDRSYVHMLNTKVLRLISLVDSTSTNFESQLDSAQDLLAYTVFYIDYLNSKGQAK